MPTAEEGMVPLIYWRFAITDVNTNEIELLSDGALDHVVGGLNPQPLPPGPPPSEAALRFASLFSHFAINQHFTVFRPFALR